MFPVNRRQFLLSSAALLSRPSFAEETGGLISSLTTETLWRNRDGKGTTWFHPRACLVPEENGKSFLLMTIQEIGSSDYFGPVQWVRSDDRGKTWTDFAPIEALGRRPMPGHEGLEKGVCDVVPEYHPPSNTTLAMGHVVFYRGPQFSRKDQLPRYPIYAVRKANGTWSEQKKLEWDDPRGSFIYTNGCGQRVVLPDGDILLALTCGSDEKNREVVGVRCAFDGDTLSIKDVGPAISHPVGRGLLEPSITSFGGRIFLTLRAEDDHGYVCVSDDGLHYSEKKAWAFDDGEALAMSTTQQHWMTHSDGLYLVYTRKDPDNRNVIRWRAPLWTARVDPDTLCLLRESERIVVPLIGDGINGPDDVALMGNFHVTNVTPQESWVTVGEWMPKREARGDTRLARIIWAKPNQLVR